MSQVLGAWWTYVLLWIFAMLLYTLGRRRRKYMLRKMLRSHDESCETCNDDLSKDCNLQLSMVLPEDDNDSLLRIQGLLQTCLDDNFHTMMGEAHPVDETWTVISYSLSGEGRENGLSLFSEFNRIIVQEKIPYHLIAVKRLGDPSYPYAYATLKEVNKLGSFE